MTGGKFFLVGYSFHFCSPRLGGKKKNFGDQGGAKITTALVVVAKLSVDMEFFLS